MSRNIRPATMKAYAFGVITGSLVTAFFATAGTAKADVSDTTVDRYAQAVCATLDEGYATFDGIVGIGIALMDFGYTAHDAGQIIAASVIGTCPEYVPLIQRFAARYNTAGYKAA